MSTLSMMGREHIKTGNFAIPEKRMYPIHDIAHARNALARVAQFGTAMERAQVYQAVKRKYPSLARQ